MRKELFSIGEAAEITRLSIDTLRRLEQKGLVTFKRIKGRRYISLPDLRKAPIFSLGKAAEVSGISYYTLRKWAKDKKISVTRSPIFRISYQEISKITKNADKFPYFFA